MCAGISVFLRAAAPTGGRDHAPASLWWLSAAITLALVAIAIALAERTGGSSSRRAAFLGIATGISWGFVAAVIKELSSHVSGGPAAIFTNWSAYALDGHRRGRPCCWPRTPSRRARWPHRSPASPSSTRSPPPCSASSSSASTWRPRRALTAEAIGLLLLAAGAFALSRSDLITAEPAVPPPAPNS